MMRRPLLLSLLLLVSFAPTSAQKRAFALEDLYRLKNLSDIHVSPDGKTVIFVVTTSDLARAKRNSHVWAMDIDGQNVRQWTVSDRSEFSPLWSPDGKQILFTSSKDGSANLYLMNAGGSEWRKITNIST